MAKYNQIVELICPACNKPFVRPAFWKAQYCSRQCANIGRAKSPMQTCQACGKELGRLYPSEILKGRIRQWCHPCYLKELAIRLTGTSYVRTGEIRKKMSLAKLGRKHPERCKSPVTIICEYCGQTKTFPGHYTYLQKQARFCSTECWYEWLRQDPTRHPSWTGGYQPYYGPNWRKQASLARQHDGNRCRCCGKRPKKQSLEVHHIIAFKSFASWKEANELSNLITLCKSCHAKDGGPSLTFPIPLF